MHNEAAVKLAAKSSTTDVAAQLNTQHKTDQAQTCQPSGIPGIVPETVLLSVRPGNLPNVIITCTTSSPHMYMYIIIWLRSVHIT